MAKIAAGVLGTTYALVADGVESLADVASSLIVWGGVAVAARPADENHPFGHGRAESLAAAVVSVMLLGAAVFIAVESIREIRTPHQFPAALDADLSARRRRGQGDARAPRVISSARRAGAPPSPPTRSIT